MPPGRTYAVHHPPPFLSLPALCLVSTLKVLWRRARAALLHHLPPAPLAHWSLPAPQSLPSAGTSDELPGDQTPQGAEPLKPKSGPSSTGGRHPYVHHRTGKILVGKILPTARKFAVVFSCSSSAGLGHSAPSSFDKLIR